MKKEKTRQSIELAGLEYFRGTYPTWNMVEPGGIEPPSASPLQAVLHV